MAEPKYPLTIGDSVISTARLQTPPVEPYGERLEIPLANRGTVVDVQPYDDSWPYVVAFEVGIEETVLVEVDVTADQIRRVAPPPGAAITQRPAVRRGRIPRVQFVLPPPDPTQSRPHRRCGALHKVNILLMCGAYGTVLGMNPVPVLVVTALVVALVYGHHLEVTKSWAWVPDMLLPEMPEPEEELVIRPGWTALAPRTDALFGLTVASLLVYHATNGASGSSYGPVLYFVLTACAFLAWIGKTVVHHKATHIVRKRDI